MTRFDRDPLTLRTARTLRETRRDAYDWWEGPQRVDKRRHGNSLRSRLVLWVRNLFV